MMTGAIQVLEFKANNLKISLNLLYKYDYKVRTFWETADLLGKRQNHEEDFF